MLTAGGHEEERLSVAREDRIMIALHRRAQHHVLSAMQVTQMDRAGLVGPCHAIDQLAAVRRKARILYLGPRVERDLVCMTALRVNEPQPFVAIGNRQPSTIGRPARRIENA